MTGSDPRTSSGPSEELARLLVHFRNDRGLPQKEVARLAEIDNSTLSRLEKGERGVSRDVLDRLAAVLDLDREARLEVLVAAGFLSTEAAQLLGETEISRLARVLNDPRLSPNDAGVLRDYVRLALSHARALGYDLD